MTFTILAMSIQDDLRRNKIPIILAGGAIAVFFGLVTIGAFFADPEPPAETSSTEPTEPEPTTVTESEPEPISEPQPEEVSPEVKFSLFRSLVADLDEDGVIIVGIESPAPGTAQIIVKENIWDTLPLDEQQELLQAWYQSWKNVYGEDARFELIAQNEAGSYQIGGSDREGEPSDLFLLTD